MAPDVENDPIQENAVADAAAAMTETVAVTASTPPEPPPPPANGDSTAARFVRVAVVLLPIVLGLALVVILFLLLPIEARQVLSAAMLLALYGAGCLWVGIWLGERRRAGKALLPPLERAMRWAQTGQWDEQPQRDVEPYKPWEV